MDTSSHSERAGERSVTVEQGNAGSGAAASRGADLRGQLRGMWAAVAPAWAAHADYADARGASMSARMLEVSAPRAGERVLELACGPGGLGLAAAERVGPSGEVVLSDLVAEMTAIAAARARARGLGNVRTRELDLERIDQPDRAFDVVLCREGLMFAPDPARAVREIARVLRPGGRAALAVWGPPRRNPWLAVVFQAVSAELGESVPPPGVPGPFALDDGDRLAALLRAAGLVDVAVAEVATPMHAASVDDWWQRTSSLAGPLALRLRLLPEARAAALRQRVEQAVAGYRVPDGLAFPGLSLIASGRRS
ncbi:MAG TPA: class I SAM-dependent methyltransferase [Chloroflexota bacterium]